MVVGNAGVETRPDTRRFIESFEAFPT
jgi:hypothetical protein